MKIAQNHVVVLTYELRLDDGRVVDSSDENKPFAFIHGIGQTLPSFDRELQDLEAGAEFSFSLTAEEAYGPYKEGFVVGIPRDNFAGAEAEIFEVGRTLPMQDEQGNSLFGTILELDEKTVKMDFNHPLAGNNLNFTGKVIEVREATKVELDHGHVHGEHGVEH